MFREENIVNLKKVDRKFMFRMFERNMPNMYSHYIKECRTISETFEILQFKRKVLPNLIPK